MPSQQILRNEHSGTSVANQRSRNKTKTKQAGGVLAFIAFHVIVVLVYGLTAYELVYNSKTRSSNAFEEESRLNIEEDSISVPETNGK